MKLNQLVVQCFTHLKLFQIGVVIDVAKTIRSSTTEAPAADRNARDSVLDQGGDVGNCALCE